MGHGTDGMFKRTLNPQYNVFQLRSNFLLCTEVAFCLALLGTDLTVAEIKHALPIDSTLPGATLATISGSHIP